MATYGQLNLGTIQDVSFFSEALKKEAKVRVYLPPEYNQENSVKVYPVVYFLHGASVNYETYSFINPIVDALWLRGSVDPFILVMPDGSCPPFNGSFYSNSSLYGNYEDLLSYDLIPYIDSTYNTIQNAKFRVIIGHSMGAYGAFKQAFKHPELYAGVAGLSGPFNIQKIDMLLPQIVAENGSPPFDWAYTPGKGLTNLIFTMAGAFSPNLTSDKLVDFPIDINGELIDSVLERWKVNNVLEMAGQLDPNYDLDIYFDCGLQDEYSLQLHGRAFAQTLSQYEISHQYIEYNGGHTNRLPIRVPIAISFADAVFKKNFKTLNDDNSPKDQIVTIYPNPGKDLFFFKTEHPDELESIHLLGLNGTIIEISDQTQSPMNLASCPPGAYFVSFNFKQTRTVLKIIKID